MCKRGFYILDFYTITQGIFKPFFNLEGIALVPSVIRFAPILVHGSYEQFLGIFSSTCTINVPKFSPAFGRVRSDSFSKTNLSSIFLTFGISLLVAFKTKRSQIFKWLTPNVVVSKVMNLQKFIRECFFCTARTPRQLALKPYPAEFSIRRTSRIEP